MQRARTRTPGALSGVAAALLLAASASAEPAKKIRFCDELLITISAEPAVQHSVTVTPDGLIEIPEVGAQPAAGFAPRALASSIAGRLGKRETSVAVSIVRRDAPDCSFIDLPPTPRPDLEPIPDALITDCLFEPPVTLPAIEFDVSDEGDTEP
ncbi:MAG TPA: polysaccharide biosynthesis/export family protein [Myxococcota bacterium]